MTELEKCAIAEIIIQHAAGNISDNTYSSTIKALREQNARENPKPLTREQLRERNGKWVWLVKYTEVYGEYAGARAYGEWKRFYSGDHDLRTYEKHWIAYDYPPEKSK